MKITDVTSFLTTESNSPTVFVKIETDEGITAGYLSLRGDYGDAEDCSAGRDALCIGGAAQ